MMADLDTIALGGEVLEDQQLSLDQLCDFCAVERWQVIEWVEEGVLETQLSAGREPLFSGTVLRRARVAVRLQRDFGVNAPGVALVLDLLERVQALERAQPRQL